MASLKKGKLAGIILFILLAGTLIWLLIPSNGEKPYSHEWKAPEIEGSRRAMTAKEIGKHLDYPFKVETDGNGELILSLRVAQRDDPLMGMGIETAPGVFEYGVYSNYAEFGKHLAERCGDNHYDGGWRCEMDGGSLIKYSLTDTSIHKVCIKVDRENHLEGYTVDYPLVPREEFSDESAAFADSLENWLDWSFDAKCSLLEESHKLTKDGGIKVLEKKLVIYSPKRFKNALNGSPIYFDRHGVTVTREGDLTVFEQEVF